MCWFKKSKDENSDIKFLKLTTVNNNYELEIVESILKENNIPYLVKEVGANGYMKIITGSILCPTDVMVTESDLEKAKSLVEAVFSHDE